MAINRRRVRELLAGFDFKALFTSELGWESVYALPPEPIADSGWMRRRIAGLAGVAIFEVFPAKPDADAPSLPDSGERARIHTQIEAEAFNNVLIFLDDDRRRRQSLLYWVKREDGKKRPRQHPYFRGQPGDLMMSKLDRLAVEIDELDEFGGYSHLQATGKVSDALDIERVTKKFYSEFRGLRLDFIQWIDGIPEEAERAWYASVLLNRLMFIYFLQRKRFINDDHRYLENQLLASQARGSDRYYSEFLEALFFQGFAKPERYRSPEARALLGGGIPYLNGGLFIRHQLESQYPIRIPDAAFDQVLKLFGKYSWYLDDAPGARDNEISPDVLGYIFEKYINQKAFGAYYTRAEITNYLCQRSIHPVITAEVNRHSQRQYASLGDILERLDAQLCHTLLFTVLPKLSLLDPACGSGAFLVAAMKNLLAVYGAVYGKIEMSNEPTLRQHIAKIKRKHPSLPYYFRKQIIVNNLYGVDIMDEAAEIARLRLFLALVGAAETVDQLEPLPNIDFNIMSGNSLIGLLAVDDSRYDAAAAGERERQGSMIEAVKARDYRQALTEKNRLIQLYRKSTSLTDDLHAMREKIDALKAGHREKLNGILLDDFHALKIQYEQAQLSGKAIKRPLQSADIASLKPFHWGYEFDQIIELRGGFDVIITNPPWEVFKPQDEEFFAKYDDSIRQKRANRVEKRRRKAALLADEAISAAYLDYQSGYRHVSAFYRNTPQYKNQISRVNGRKQGTDINLYKLFSEQCFNLLREGGACGIVIPSGIYSDLGTKQLRSMLFDQARVTSLFGFENRKAVFEGVHRSFKFIVLTFLRGGRTESFPAAFMRHDVAELEDFRSDGGVSIDIDLIKRSSPASLSVTEFKSALDVQITEKMLRFPLLGDELPDSWNVKLQSEFHMTNDSDLFRDAPGQGRLPLYEGKMIWQFEHGYAAPRYWIDEAAGRKRVLGKYGKDEGQVLGYQGYRFGYRAVASGTNERSLVASVIPPALAGNSLIVSETVLSHDLLSCTAFVNSYVVDWCLRQKVAANINMFYVYQLPVPRLTATDPFFAPIVQRAARLICTAPEYDALASQVGLGSHRHGATDPAERARLRAELDGMIAHIYGLTHDEFAYVLGAFRWWTRA